ncbi:MULTISPECIES: restriction endonuclease [Bacillus cereus group]
MYNINEGLVVTTSHFNKLAMKITDSTGTILWDRQRISEMINLLN